MKQGPTQRLWGHGRTPRLRTCVDSVQRNSRFWSLRGMGSVCWWRGYTNNWVHRSSLSQSRPRSTTASPRKSIILYTSLWALRRGKTSNHHSKLRAWFEHIPWKEGLLFLACGWCERKVLEKSAPTLIFRMSSDWNNLVAGLLWSRPQGGVYWLSIDSWLNGLLKLCCLVIWQITLYLVHSGVKGISFSWCLHLFTMDIIFCPGRSYKQYTFTQCCLGSPFVDILKSLLKDNHFKLILKPIFKHSATEK